MVGLALEAPGQPEAKSGPPGFERILDLQQHSCPDNYARRALTFVIDISEAASFQ